MRSPNEELAIAVRADSMIHAQPQAPVSRSWAKSIAESRLIPRPSERLVLGTLGVLAFFTVWEIGARLGLLNPLFFSSPTEVLGVAQVEFSTGTIWPHLLTSLSELIAGVSAAAVIGIVIGFSAGWFKHAHYVIDPWVTVLYSTPKVAFIPLIILVFGIDFGARVFVVALMAVFSIIVNTMIGVQSARGSYLLVARSFSASSLMQWRSVVLPASAPFILTGLRLALGHGMIGVVVAELMSGNQGIGYMIKRAAFTLHTGPLILGVVLIGTWGMFSGELMRRVEQRVEAWRDS